ncbi:hypothetical protein FA95DRAFT_1568198 [Auriscalpium vulgare]|uniref:Uncharacterized protein n=1 Tax=Auriscalpium vulgare TaxID=40419 RepID=A0ACB8SD99_9AGAM|nr:hypothetical protein FA95DRAFT_1568198 [Auriscalpium vulgare]
MFFPRPAPSRLLRGCLSSACHLAHSSHMRSRPAEPAESAERPVPSASTDKGKAKEDVTVDADGDIKMEDAPVVPDKIPEARAIPTGPRNSGKAFAPPAQHPPPVITNAKARADWRRPTQPSPAQASPSTPIRVEPDAKKEETITERLIRLSQERDSKWVGYHETMRAVRRAEHEFAMVALDLQAARERRRMTAAQLKLAQEVRRLRKKTYRGMKVSLHKTAYWGMKVRLHKKEMKARRLRKTT